MLTFFLDHWRTLFLPYCLGLDKEMVRPYHHLENLHSFTAPSPTYAIILH